MHLLISLLILFSFRSVLSQVTLENGCYIVEPPTPPCIDAVDYITGVSQCERRRQFCNDPQYYNVMTIQCPQTCNRCNVTACFDRVNPRTGVFDCEQRRALCNNPTFLVTMRTRCARTCGYCIRTFLPQQPITQAPVLRALYVCEDLIPACPLRAVAGYCQKYAYQMYIIMVDVIEKVYLYSQVDEQDENDDDPQNFTEIDVRRIEEKFGRQQLNDDIDEINYRSQRGGASIPTRPPPPGWNLSSPHPPNPTQPPAPPRPPLPQQSYQSYNPYPSPYAGSHHLPAISPQSPRPGANIPFIDNSQTDSNQQIGNFDSNSQKKKKKKGFRFSIIRDALDGFERGDFSGILKHLSRIGGENHCLKPSWTHDKIRQFTEGAISRGAHRFFKIDKNTGQIIGALAGNVIFNKGGKNNNIGGVGKIVLDNILTGHFHKNVSPLVHQSEIRRTAGIESLGLDFYRERDKCLKTKRLFEDPEFPATSKSLYYRRAPTGRVEWRRPGEIVRDPCLIVEGHTRFDVVQGALGDCWLLAAIANLTLRDELFYRVVPPDQSFVENYAGIFHFQFWRYGRWVDVVIDDRLPTVNGKLIYMHSGTVNEFWSALLEKAYAKLYTGYECLDGGLPMDALEDFTGGLTEHLELQKIDKATLLALLVRGFQMGSMFCCSLEADPYNFEAQLPNGLIRGHAYSITAVQQVSTTRGDVLLLRIRNPWGNNKEWYGPWSDGSSEWRTVSGADRTKLDVRFNDDGEFWMSFNDFYISFETLEVCNLSAAVMSEIEQMTGVRHQDIQEVGVWQEQQIDGGWSLEHNTAGGCINYISTFPRNPQYLVTLVNARNNVEGDGNCTVIVAVLQKYRRELRSQGKDNIPIGFSVYRAPPNLMGKLDERFFRTNRSVAKVPVFVNMREVTARFRVPPGQYIVIPCTFEPHIAADFLLRVFSNGDVGIREIA
ncbi:unnamed protein product, partial [Mesorhabditis belari]|uniref:Calpain catalytic domain-containing protein n=1 Tax=Mesorhabditis belari TaxID=2138241 RepID=A0AAF3FFG5_9BILA